MSLILHQLVCMDSPRILNMLTIDLKRSPQRISWTLINDRHWFVKYSNKQREKNVKSTLLRQKPVFVNEVTSTRMHRASVTHYYARVAAVYCICVNRYRTENLICSFTFWSGELNLHWGDNHIRGYRVWGPYDFHLNMHRLWDVSGEETGKGMCASVWSPCALSTR